MVKSGQASPETESMSVSKTSYLGFDLLLWTMWDLSLSNGVFQKSITHLSFLSAA